MERVHHREILDDPVEDVGEYEHALAQIADVNRFLGGERALRMSLAALLGESDPVRVLDVGAGNGEVALGVARWAEARGRHWTVTGIDLSAEASAVAGRRVRTAALGGRVAVLRADGLRLPFGDKTFDAAYTVLTLHHFDDDAAVALLREMARVVRRLVIVNDLHRSRAAWLGARALAVSVWKDNRLTRNDGPLSVLRAYKPVELLALAERAGLKRPTVRHRVAFRLVLEAAP
jgi:ubiquinone/menaquinone biosynthesis C-methylase UbiE